GGSRFGRGADAGLGAPGKLSAPLTPIPSPSRGEGGSLGSVCAFTETLVKSYPSPTRGEGGSLGGLTVLAEMLSQQPPWHCLSTSSSSSPDLIRGLTRRPARLPRAEKKCVLQTPSAPSAALRVVGSSPTM